MERLISEKRILWPADPAGRPRRKNFLDELTSDFTGFSSIVGENCYTRNGTADVEALFGFRAMDFPKPVALIREFLKQGSEENDIVLDFFAGSGTTGQAVLDLNRTDSGNRRFILVQLPELADKRSEACKAGFKKISDITIERVKRVINGREGQLPFDESGFKVYKLTKSSFPRVEFAPDPEKTPEENVELLKEYIREKETAFHIAFEKEKIFDEVLLKNGFMLDYTLTQQVQFTANAVYLVKDTYREALLCLDVPLDMATVDYFKGHKEQRFICLEQALDTTRKWNLKHHLGDKFVAF
jgi:adenine-specific DNA-methyltransferase